MSVGMFLGITASFLPDHQNEALKFIHEINRALRRIGRPAYVEPEERQSPYVDGRFGRSSLDHNAAGTLAALADYCPQGKCVGLELLAANPYRVSFLPMAFPESIETDYAERIDGEMTDIWIGSIRPLTSDLSFVAEALSIPLVDGALSDEIARQIDNSDQLGQGDFSDLDHREAWLMLYEGCRLATEFQVALSFAG
jgi:hypothetical protein